MFFEPIILALQKLSGYLVRRNKMITCIWENVSNFRHKRVSKILESRGGNCRDQHLP